MGTKEDTAQVAAGTPGVGADVLIKIDVYSLKETMCAGLAWDIVVFLHKCVRI